MRVEEEGEDTEGCYPISHVMVHVQFLGDYVGVVGALKYGTFEGL